MDTGQVAFHKDSLVKRVHVPQKDKEILARLNKTRVERDPDLAQERLERDKRDRLTAKEYERQMVCRLLLRECLTHRLFKYVQKQEALEKEKRRTEAAALKNYSNVFTEENMISNTKRRNVEEDFM
jgi:hypothetical protein